MRVSAGFQVLWHQIVERCPGLPGNSKYVTHAAVRYVDGADAFSFERGICRHSATVNDGQITVFHLPGQSQVRNSQQYRSGRIIRRRKDLVYFYRFVGEQDEVSKSTACVNA